MFNSLIVTADVLVGDHGSQSLRLLVDTGLPDEGIYKLLYVLEKKVPSTTGAWYIWSYDMGLPFEDLTQTPNVFLNIKESFKEGREITIPELTEELATKNTFTSEVNYPSLKEGASTKEFQMNIFKSRARKILARRSNYDIN